MDAKGLVRAVVAITALLGLAGCGALNTDSGSFVGRTYNVVEISENGSPKPLVADTQVSLTFTEDGIAAAAGCNTMFGSGGVVDGALNIDDLASTQMACDPPVMAQEQWWGQFLSSKPAIEVGDRALTLTSGGTAVKLVAEETVEDLPLAGTAWQLETTIFQDAASSVPEAGASTLSVTETSITVTVGTCRTTQVPASFTPTTITYQPAPFATGTCSGAAKGVDAAVMAALATGSVDYVIEGTRLTLSSPDGVQLGYAGS